MNRFIEAFGDKGRLYIKGLKEAVSANLYWHLKERFFRKKVETVKLGQ